MNVFRHRHELVRGRTSSMSRQLIGMSDDGSISNQNSFVSHWKDIIRSSSKLIMFIDLAGHKRYQKTTLFGITSQFPDYALLAVSGTTGVSDITREHLQVALALKIAVFVVITKADLCTNQYPSLTMDQLSKTISALDPSRRLVEINSRQDILQYTERMLYESDIPAFVLSCVTGIGLDDFQFFLQNLQKPYDWTTHSCEETEFLIDEIHEVNRVGVVVTGLIVRGAIGMGAVLMLGPFSDGKFFKVTVSSIHVHRSPVKRAFSGQTASLAIKKIRREEIRKGMVLVDPVLHPKGCFEFEVEITLLFDASRLDVQHEFVLNVDTVTQSARIVHIDNCLVEGSNGKISFKFRHQPEYLRIGAKVIFREANEIIGAGIVSRILD